MHAKTPRGRAFALRSAWLRKLLFFLLPLLLWAGGGSVASAQTIGTTPDWAETFEGAFTGMSDFITQRNQVWGINSGTGYSFSAVAPIPTATGFTPTQNLDCRIGSTSSWNRLNGSGAIYTDPYSGNEIYRLPFKFNTSTANFQPDIYLRATGLTPTTYTVASGYKFHFSGLPGSTNTVTVSKVGGVAFTPVTYNLPALGSTNWYALWYGVNSGRLIVAMQNLTTGNWLDKTANTFTIASPVFTAGSNNNVIDATDASPLTGAGQVQMLWNGFDPGGSSDVHVDDLALFSFASGGAALTAGTGPTFSSVASTTLTVNWGAATGGTAPYTYKVERAPDAAGGSAVTSAGTFATIVASQSGITYADSGLTPNKTYWYRISATDSAGTPATIVYNALGSSISTASAVSFAASYGSLPSNHNGNIAVTLTPSSTHWQSGGGLVYSIVGGTGVSIPAQPAAPANDTATVILNIAVGAVGGTAATGPFQIKAHTTTDGDVLSSAIAIVTPTLTVVTSPAPLTSATGSATLTFTSNSPTWQADAPQIALTAGFSPGTLSLGTTATFTSTSAVAPLSGISAAGTFSLTDPSTGAVSSAITISAAVVPVTVSIDDSRFGGATTPHLVIPENGWAYDVSTTPHRVITTSYGNYIKFAFSFSAGSTNYVKFNISTANITADTKTVVGVILDGNESAYQWTQISGGQQLVANNLGVGSHTLRLFISQVNIVNNRWTVGSGLNGIAITGFDISTGGTALDIRDSTTGGVLDVNNNWMVGYTKRLWLAAADSTGAGYNVGLNINSASPSWNGAQGSGANRSPYTSPQQASTFTWLDDPAYGYMWQVGESLGAEVSMSGIEAGGWAGTTAAGVVMPGGTTLPNLDTNYFSDFARPKTGAVLTYQPDYVLTLLGRNNWNNGALPTGTASTTYQNTYLTNFYNDMHALCPNSLLLFGVPLQYQVIGGVGVHEWEADTLAFVTSKASDPKVRAVNARLANAYKDGGPANTANADANTIDGIHMNVAQNARERALLSAAVGAATGTTSGGTNTTTYYGRGRRIN